MLDPQQIAVAAQFLAQKDAALLLAAKLQLPFVTIDDRHYKYLLVLTASHLELRDINNKNSNPLYIDFLGGEAAYRRKHGGGRGQLIARAVQAKPGLKVLDATAGLGRDAFVLAALGCTVTLIERSQIVAALLTDGIDRAQNKSDFASIDINLIITDAISYLQNLQPDAAPDVVYLDPMFPARTKSALVKKEMRILHDIVGADEDAPQLLQAALNIAKKRVVVKRAKLAPALAGPNVSLVYKGKSSRFDVYLITGG